MAEFGPEVAATPWPSQWSPDLLAAVMHRYGADDADASTVLQRFEADRERRRIERHGSLEAADKFAAEFEEWQLALSASRKEALGRLPGQQLSIFTCSYRRP